MARRVATAGQAIINSHLPRYARDYGAEMSKRNIVKAFNKIALKDPGRYADIVGRIKKVGEDASYVGDSSFSLNDFRTPIDKSILRREADKLAKENIAGKKINLDRMAEKFTKIQKDLESKAMVEAKKKGNVLAMMVDSGARGKPSQFSSTTVSSVMFSDQKNSPIPIVIESSISDGMTPAEYFGNSYGARKGVIATKFATPEGGFFNKQVGYVAGEVTVAEDDCGTRNGIETTPDDLENTGRLLARSAGGYPADTILDPKILSDLIKKRVKKIIIRSPMTCESHDAVCKKCYGLNEKNRFLSVGDNPGIVSSSAISEPFTQAAMDTKHTGGLIGAQKKGMPLVKQLLKIPKVFAGGATVSEINGKIKSIEKAPQGGMFVDVFGGEEQENVRHYVQPNMGLKVKKGDTIEQGLPLSEGIVNPSDVTRLRGIGEGRKYLAQSIKDGFKQDGKGYVNKRHMEVLAKSMVTGVRIDDHESFDDYVPGDIVPIEHAQKNYKPKDVHASGSKNAVGKFLAKPYLHHTIGTKVTPMIAKEIEQSGDKQFAVTSERPPFSPIMVRLDDVPSMKRNWVNRLFSIHLKKKLMDSVHRGDSTRESGKGFVAPLIRGVDFGKNPKGY